MAKNLPFNNSNNILPTGVFWGPEYDSQVKIQNGGCNMVAKIAAFYKSDNFYPQSFFGTPTPIPSDLIKGAFSWKMSIENCILTNTLLISKILDKNFKKYCQQRNETTIKAVTHSSREREPNQISLKSRFRGYFIITTKYAIKISNACPCPAKKSQQHII